MGITMAQGEGIDDFEVIFDPLVNRRCLLWCWEFLSSLPLMSRLIGRLQRMIVFSFSSAWSRWVRHRTSHCCGCWKVARTPCYKTATGKQGYRHACTHTGSARTNPRTRSTRKCVVKMPRLASKAVLSYLYGSFSKPLWFCCFQTCAVCYADLISLC